MLETECREARVAVFLNTKIQEVARSADFIVRTANAELHAQALVIATGGLSIPKIGATSFGYDLAKQFDIGIKQPYPALVPLTFNADDCSHYCDLAGVSTPVIASCGKQQFRENLLITHRGLSGPAILQISSYWQISDDCRERQAVHIDLAPEHKITDAFQNAKLPRTPANLRSLLRRVLPQRLADRWIDLHMPQSWTNQALADFEKQAHDWQVIPSGTEGYEKAEVTAGGIDTEELSASTMETKMIPGLFFIGEVVDVTGQLGGFNFQWAWASGAAAGRAL